MPQAGFLFLNLTNMKTLRIAIQKSGRLHTESLRLLRECGIEFDSEGEKLKVESSSFPAEVLYVRNSDIPEYVQDGVADIGIVGENLVVERSAGKRTESGLENSLSGEHASVRVLQSLGFGRCRLSLAVPRTVEYTSLEYFRGKRVATSYPRTAARFFRDNGIDVVLHEISGSVEIAPGLGLADGVCDLVSSGNTLYSNGLREVHTLFYSEAVVIAAQYLRPDAEQLIGEVLVRIQSVLAARRHRYILLNIPTERIADAARVLPGMKSPTVMPLAQPGWSSLHSVIEYSNFWPVIAQLKALGAEGILVIPIENMVL